MKLSRKRVNHPRPSSERWLISYADFITLLFAFFTVMYATSEKDFKEAEKFQESIKKHLISAGAFGGSGQKIASGDQHSSIIPPPIPTFKTIPEEIQKSQEELIELLEQTLTQKSMRQLIIEITAENQSVDVSLAGDIFFDEKNEITASESKSTLIAIANFLANLNNPVIVRGHYNLTKNTNSEAWKLSAQRALRVLEFLSAQGNLPQKRLALMAFGPTQPLVSPRNAKAERYNQRVTISIQYDDQIF